MNTPTPSNDVLDDPILKARLIKAIGSNWQEEKQGEATYRTLAERDDDPLRKQVLLEMAEEEANHARRWAQRLKELGAPEPVYTGADTGMVDTLANRIGGPDATLRRIELIERQDVARYGRQIKELGDKTTITILADLMADEKMHSRRLRTLERPSLARVHSGFEVLKPRDPITALEAMRAGRGRKTPASWIGDAIYGVNDGLGAIFGIVSGVSGATLGDSKYVLLAGLAGTIASALSMGSGAYLASKSEREIYEAEVHRKSEQIESNPDESLEEMSLIYQVKGIPLDEANKMSQHLFKDRAQFLRTLTAEELNVTEEALSNPITAAVSGSISTAIGAAIPIIPFFFLHGIPAVIAAAVISLIAHFAVGAAKSAITVRSWWSSGMEMTIIGAVEGIVTYLIGVGLGHIGA